MPPLLSYLAEALEQIEPSPDDNANVDEGPLDQQGVVQAAKIPLASEKHSRGEASGLAHQAVVASRRM